MNLDTAYDDCYNYVRDRSRDKQITRVTKRLLKATRKNSREIPRNPDLRYIFHSDLPDDIAEIRVTPVPDLLGMGMMWTRVGHFLPGIDQRFGRSIWCRTDGSVFGRDETYYEPLPNIEDEPDGEFTLLNDHDELYSFTKSMLVVARYLEEKIVATEVTAVPIILDV